MKLLNETIHSELAVPGKLMLLLRTGITGTY